MEVQILREDSTLKLEKSINKWLKDNVLFHEIKSIQYSSHSYGYNNSQHEYSAMITYTDLHTQSNQFGEYTYEY